MVSVQEGIYKLGRLHQICPFTGVRDRGDDDQARLRGLPPASGGQCHQQQTRDKSGGWWRQSNPVTECKDQFYPLTM